ncbi:glycosyltransferase family 2 protein [Leptospira sp. 201903070]|uniref:Glycosyltransferase family 2 protein n=1 Tax=Leptospira ainlahdjerensis TaxID=2810033 RepID=A0ABS2UCJ0_9LEPT|nr:glycosyltransferase family 2 protein [Leptospira ainlahdjerensis]MBM9577268.1 glycosyltransferase family 2 protein [Leptospira ainlahdjerensis]
MQKSFSPIAIIVTFNPELPSTLENIQNLNAKNVPVLVVDNHSKNIEKIRSQIQKPNLLIENKNNLGLGYALNRGIEYAKKNSYSHVWLFDQDSLLEIQAIETFLQIVSRDENQTIRGKKIGSYGPNIFDTIKNRNIYGIENGKGLLENSFLITSGSFYPLRVLEDVGLINEDFFIDYLDYEWCFRAAHKGYVHCVVCDARMKHSIGNQSRKILGLFSISIHSPFRWYFLFRNGLLICKMSHIPFRFKLEVLFKTGLRFWILPFLSDSILQTYRHIFRGIFDGITGKESAFFKKLVSRN